MSIYYWILVVGFGVFVISFLYILINILLVGRPKDYAAPKGKVFSAIAYSFTGAMSPSKKESAYLHLPTYTAGMLFHLGTFVSLLWILLFFLNSNIGHVISYLSMLFIIASSVCGISIFIKRIFQTNLRALSHPDDYFSNLLVTAFQIITALTLYSRAVLPVLFVYTALMLVYIPIGKLRHAIYFFSSRIYLGIYYGKRGVWK